jgi:hypothetical protein
MKKTKTKKPREIPDAYQFTAEDIQWYWDNFDKCSGKNGVSPEATKAELYFFNLVDEADRLSRLIKRLPTMLELTNYGQAAERERRRLASWQAHYRFNEKDLAEYEALLAREEFGPFADFVRVVVQMKKATGDFPTVQEVRAHCETAV